MRILGFKTLKLYWRWVRSRFIDHALILGYHRVAEIQHDPFSLCVSPQNFKEQMEVLQTLANPISLEELVHAIADSQLPPKAVVVTFDDGYADNLYEAKPLMEYYEIPAMVFIVTGSIGSQFWWDEMEHILLFPKRLPERLEISFNDFTFEWNSGNSSFESPGNGSFEHRKHLLRTLYQKLLTMSFEARKRIITHLRDWSGFEPEESSFCRTMTSDELIQLVSGGLIDVGAHTLSHPILSELAEIEQRMEVLKGKEILEKILDCKVKSFSYPHGQLSEETLTIVKNSGFLCACASHNDVAWSGSDNFQLPRFWIQNWDGQKFERWLKRWLNS
jgi:peptidoglycan/xylan/chitin deacetylase (PgdA/CDA1 family)